MNPPLKETPKTTDILKNHGLPVPTPWRVTCRFHPHQWPTVHRWWKNPASAGGCRNTRRGLLGGMKLKLPLNLYELYIIPFPETNIAPEKWMVGRGRSFPFRMAYFQVRTVCFGESKWDEHIYCSHLLIEVARGGEFQKPPSLKPCMFQ